MSKRKITALAAALLCGLLLVLPVQVSVVEGLAGVVLANGTPAIDWYVIGGGGVHHQVDPYALDATIGQAVVGTATDAGFDLCSGFWWGMKAGACRSYLPIYLPLVLRDY
jgi:hypothetical protein